MSAGEAFTLYTDPNLCCLVFEMKLLEPYSKKKSISIQAVCDCLVASRTISLEIRLRVLYSLVLRTSQKLIYSLRILVVSKCRNRRIQQFGGRRAI
jgi:hypothetical protein